MIHGGGCCICQLYSFSFHVTIFYCAYLLFSNLNYSIRALFGVILCQLMLWKLFIPPSGFAWMDTSVCDISLSCSLTVYFLRDSFISRRAAPHAWDHKPWLVHESLLLFTDKPIDKLNTWSFIDPITTSLFISTKVTWQEPALFWVHFVAGIVWWSGCCCWEAAVVHMIYRKKTVSDMYFFLKCVLTVNRVKGNKAQNDK